MVLHAAAKDNSKFQRKAFNNALGYLKVFLFCWPQLLLPLLCGIITEQKLLNAKRAVPQIVSCNCDNKKNSTNCHILEF